MLAILKAGGAYVPLDSRYPMQRLSYILEDTGARLIVTQEGLQAVLPETRAEMVRLDGEWEEISKEAGDDLGEEVGEGNLAYLIYTSGSTGKPKGVAIEHHSAVTLIHWAIEKFSRQSLSAVLASTSICFDLSIFEIFVTLSIGGKIILAKNALHLANLAAAEEVTLINTVPSAMTELLRLNAVPKSVKTVNLAGEPLQRALVDQIYDLNWIEQVNDLYGPSEDTTYTTFVKRKKGGPVTIGRPIANTQIYLLDKQLQPVPTGVNGELYIGGEGLARGYFAKPDQTADRFIPNPFGKPGSRFYKTGDLARYLPDGNIEFLGRIDHQVKVRGYRIELGEIETHLRDHLAVKEAVVIVRQDQAANHQIIAYVVMKEDASLQPTPDPAEINLQLRNHLKQYVPDYMLPALIMVIDAIPLTPNGKLDRARLPEPAQADRQKEANYAEAQTDTERTLAGIWEELLGVKGIGIHDNFFEVGGHSLLATQLISKIRTAFNVELSVRGLFETPTIAEFAKAIDNAEGGHTESRLPAIMKVSREAYRTKAPHKG